MSAEDTMWKRIKDLEERIAFTEVARDNALVMRDEVQTRAKLSGQSAGRRINELVALVRHSASFIEADVVKGTIEQRLVEILGKNDGRLDQPAATAVRVEKCPECQGLTRFEGSVDEGGRVRLNGPIPVRCNVCGQS